MMTTKMTALVFVTLGSLLACGGPTPADLLEGTWGPETPLTTHDDDVASIEAFVTFDANQRYTSVTIQHYRPDAQAHAGCAVTTAYTGTWAADDRLVVRAERVVERADGCARPDDNYDLTYEPTASDRVVSVDFTVTRSALTFQRDGATTRLVRVR